MTLQSLSGGAEFSGSYIITSGGRGTTAKPIRLTTSAVQFTAAPGTAPGPKVPCVSIRGTSHLAQDRDLRATELLHPERVLRQSGWDYAGR
jgi:hypothetical protein